ncbi:DUF5347 family protein [Acerihabitans sp. TG2]|uniref:DUF5347 family protein n=1 Tax=Acerihabitans sp. TG2 TaxID=3096008 RepID=UPI002B23B97E|nr:DUF5347 family protein [Acerihabitans sp. TG2]MEA9393157.1 DUF5347 family protein [Acerihabitans sp. TG2]
MLDNISNKQNSLRRIRELKQLFPQTKNITQQAYNALTPRLKRLICFHAGLQQRHVVMEYEELLVNERKAVIRAMSEIQAMGTLLPSRMMLTDSCIE